MIERVNPIFNYEIGYNLCVGKGIINCLYYHDDEDVGDDHSNIRISLDHSTNESFRNTITLRTKVYTLTHYLL